jgi:ABC-type uncharacterized transport system ATPase subunit
MVHQELMLVRPFTVAENVALGLAEFNLSYPIRQVERRVRELSERYGLWVDPKARIEDLSAGEQQRVEIIKVLYHDPDVIILDEPTSTPHAGGGGPPLRRPAGMAAEGHGVLFITHKMKEVFKVSDRVTVLKLGKAMGTKRLSETDEEELSRLMFGEHVGHPTSSGSRSGVIK